MKKFKLLFAAMLSMMAWTGVMAQTAEEYEAALAAITDGAWYRISTEVDGTKFYVTTDGTLTSEKALKDVFTLKKIASGGAYMYDDENTAIGIQMTSTTDKRFTNSPLSNSKAVLEVANFSTTTNNRADWESQVLFLKDGKYAIRSCNTVYAETSWQDAGRTFWTYTVDPVDPEYSYDPAYVWNLEEDEFAAQQYAAYNTVQSWPVYLQGAKGLVKDASKFYSNAKEPSEGSYEALIDETYTTFFHSAWSVSVDETHYLQAELSEDIQEFSFYFKKRSQNNNNRPTTIVVSASNDGDEFTEITTLNSGFPTDASVTDYMSGTIDLGAKYKYVRFSVTATNSGSKFFTFSEFYLFQGSEAVANVAANYNTFATKAWSSLTAEDIAAINEADDALKNAITTVKVTYELYEADGTTLADSKEVVQEPNSEISVPASLTSNTFYDYTTTGTIGSQDCTIKTVRTLKAGVVGTLADLSNEKAYTITCDRGAMLTNGTTIASTANSTYASAEPGQFAIINYEDNYYLYSVADSKFVANNGSLVEKPSNGVLDALQMTPKAVPYFMFYFTVSEGTNYGVNTNGTGNLGGIVINDWMSADAGNQYYMVEAADFDATDALAALYAYFNPTYTVTYEVKDNDGKVLFTSDPEPSEEGAKITSLPEKYQRAFYTYDEIDETVTEEETTVTFTATWAGPFELSTTVDNAKWYTMTIRSDYSVFVGETEPYYPKKADAIKKMTDEYQWAFAGDAYNGITLFNKAKGEGWTLTKDGSNVVMREGTYAWEIGKNSDGFTLKEIGTAYNCVNQNGGSSGPLQFWNSSNSPTDNGSTFRVEAAKTELDLAIGETGYATTYLPFAVSVPEGVTAYTAEFENTWLKLNAVTGTIPATTAVILKGEAGTYKFNIAAEAEAITGNVLKGTLESIEATGKYVLAQPEGEAVGFYLADKGTIAANKAYLEIADADVKGFTFVFGGDATGISETVNANALTGKWYNVAGQRVNKAQKGIYIVNGKKVVK